MDACKFWFCRVKIWHFAKWRKNFSCFSLSFSRSASPLREGCAGSLPGRGSACVCAECVLSASDRSLFTLCRALLAGCVPQCARSLARCISLLLSSLLRARTKTKNGIAAIEELLSFKTLSQSEMGKAAPFALAPNPLSTSLAIWCKIFSAPCSKPPLGIKERDGKRLAAKREQMLGCICTHRQCTESCSLKLIFCDGTRGSFRVAAKLSTSLCSLLHFCTRGQIP